VVESQAAYQLEIARVGVDDFERRALGVAKPTNDADEGAHEGRIHHRAVFEIDDEVADAAPDHVAHIVFQLRAVLERALALDTDPDHPVRELSDKNWGVCFHVRGSGRESRKQETPRSRIGKGNRPELGRFSTRAAAR